MVFNTRPSEELLPVSQYETAVDTIDSESEADEENDRSALNSGLKYDHEETGWCANHPKCAWAFNQLGFLCACVLAWVIPDPLVEHIIFPQYQRIKVHYWEKDASALLDSSSPDVEEMEDLLKHVPSLLDNDDENLKKLKALYVEVASTKQKKDEEHSAEVQKREKMLKDAGVSGDIIAKVLESTDNPSHQLTKLQLLTPCPEKCLKCTAGGKEDGGVALIDDRCQHWCSTGGNCGKSEAYKSGVVCDTCNSEAKKKELGEEIWKELNSKNFA